MLKLVKFFRSYRQSFYRPFSLLHPEGDSDMLVNMLVENKMGLHSLLLQDAGGVTATSSTSSVIPLPSRAVCRHTHTCAGEIQMSVGRRLGKMHSWMFIVGNSRGCHLLFYGAPYICEGFFVNWLSNWNGNKNICIKIPALTSRALPPY